MVGVVCSSLPSRNVTLFDSDFMKALCSPGVANLSSTGID